MSTILEPAEAESPQIELPVACEPPMMPAGMIGHRTVSINGINTGYLDIGEGPTLVALHGIPTSSALFEPLVPYLRRRRLLAPDLLGHGHTDVPAAGALGFEEYARHLDGFLKVMAPQKFDLVVHDFGGVLGLRWAAMHPERVRRVLILSTTVDWSVRWAINWAVLYGGSLLGGARALNWAMRETLKRPTADDSLIDVWSRPWTRRRVWRGADHFAPRHLANLRKQLRRLSMPVLIIWGQEDHIFPLRHARQILKRLPHARAVTIPACGHWSTLDAPAEVGWSLAGFLAADE